MFCRKRILHHIRLILEFEEWPWTGRGRGREGGQARWQRNGDDTIVKTYIRGTLTDSSVQWSVCATRRITSSEYAEFPNFDIRLTGKLREVSPKITLIWRKISHKLLCMRNPLLPALVSNFNKHRAISVRRSCIQFSWILISLVLYQFHWQDEISFKFELLRVLSFNYCCKRKFSDYFGLIIH